MKYTQAHRILQRLAHSILSIAAIATMSGCASTMPATPSGYTYKNFGQGPNFRWTTPSGRVVYHWETHSGADCDAVATEVDMELERNKTKGIKLTCTSDPVPDGYTWKLVLTGGHIEAEAYFPSFAECEKVQKEFETPKPGSSAWVRVKCFNSANTANTLSL